jgi:flagella basal body P-ring formation protein FlgA
VKKPLSLLPWRCAPALAAVLPLAAAAAPAADAAALDDALAGEVRRIAGEGTRAMAPGARVEIEVGRLDPRLKLAPCDQVQPYLPAQTRLWGRTRIGLRCVQGPSRWNVYLPITVKVHARAWVAAAALPAGSVLAAADLREAEIDWAEEPGAAYAQPEALIGRTLARPLAAGAGVRAPHLKVRVWFAAGDTVRITTVGNGYTVAGHGEALTPGVEGQAARVRTEAGRIVSAAPVGERQVELTL